MIGHCVNWVSASATPRSAVKNPKILRSRDSVFWKSGVVWDGLSAQNCMDHNLDQFLALGGKIARDPQIAQLLR
jgi:hypothetical protein